MTTDQAFIERAEAARDLKTQLGALAQNEESEISFVEWSPGRKLVTIWNTETGEEATLPRYQALAAINHPNSTHTGFMWTGVQKNAPPQRINTVKCFLHPESPEREFLSEIGVTTTCMSEHLASNASKWEHARNRHGAAFRVYQEEMNRIRTEEDRAEQRQQTEAMLKLAGDGGSRRKKEE